MGNAEAVIKLTSAKLSVRRAIDKHREKLGDGTEEGDAPEVAYTTGGNLVALGELVKRQGAYIRNLHGRVTALEAKA